MSLSESHNTRYASGTEYLDCLSESRRKDSNSPGWTKILCGLLMVAIPFVAIGCSNLTGPSSCRVLADEAYNPWDYLGWRGSRNSRFSSITHALPCSTYVASAPSTITMSTSSTGTSE